MNSIIKKHLAKRIVLISIFLLLFTTSLFIGSARFTIGDLINDNGLARTILFSIRIPRTITVILTAAGLSIAGLILQVTNRNKFISPSTMGATQGARLGMTLMIILGVAGGSLTKFIFGFGASFITSIFFLYLIKNIKSKGGIYVPLVGLMYTAILTALITFIGYHFDVLQIIEGLSIGSFAHIISFNYFYIYLIIPAIVIAIIYSVKFGIVGMGKDFTSNLGINYERTLMIGLIVVSLISAITYVVIGPVPLLGLVVPNVISLYLGDNVKKNIVDISLLGASFLLICDIIARVIVWPYELPISVISSVVGGAIFLILIMRGRKHA